MKDGHIPYPVRAVVATPGTVKVWNNTFVGPPDPFWNSEAGYDDSAWANGVAVTMNNANAFHPDARANVMTMNGYGPLPTPTAFSYWPDPVPVDPHDPSHPLAFLWRFHFDNPPDPGTWWLGAVELWSWAGNPNNLSPNPILFRNAPPRSIGAFPGGPWNYPYTGAFGFTATMVEPGVLVGSLRWDSTLGSVDFWVAFRLIFFQLDGVSSGSVSSWGTPAAGASDKGAMGTGASNVASAVPVATLAPANTIKVSSNGLTTMFLCADGTIYGCGDNSTGMLGIGSADSSDHSVPIRIGTQSFWAAKGANIYDLDFGGYSMVDVSVGGDCVMALSHDGTVWRWGKNASGSCGTGNTTQQNSPVNVQFALAASVAAGNNFGAYTSFFGGHGPGGDPISGVTNTISVAGDNTYGVFANGTTTSSTSYQTSFLPTDWDFEALDYYYRVSAAADVVWIVNRFGSALVGAAAYGCGRGEWGNLGWDQFQVGTGPHKITTSFNNDLQQSTVLQAEPIGPLTFLLSRFADVNFINIWGDGTPYGGDGSNANDGFVSAGTPPAFRIWGTTDGTNPTPPLETSIIGSALIDTFDAQGSDPNQQGLPFFEPIQGIAFGSSASNAFSLGNSLAAFSAFSYGKLTSFFAAGPFNGLLYTWGYGGLGQMGNGLIAATNIKPISQNGLTGVISATCTAGIMFAIQGSIGPVTPARRGRSFVQMIGD